MKKYIALFIAILGIGISAAAFAEEAPLPPLDANDADAYGLYIQEYINWAEGARRLPGQAPTAPSAPGFSGIGLDAATAAYNRALDAYWREYQKYLNEIWYA